MENKKRYTTIDILRGCALIAMILYHLLWDLVNIFDVSIEWFDSSFAHIMQQCIRNSFILLSGFCWALSNNKLKRGLIVFSASILITLGTKIFMPNAYILFGVLSLIGSAMLFTIPLDKVYSKMNAYLGIILCLFLFYFTKNVGSGYLGFEDIIQIYLPLSLYNNHIGAYLGFPGAFFKSTDYVPIFPFVFLFWIGYFIYRICKEKDLLKYFTGMKCEVLEYIGKHSLLIYMLHQPLIYAVLFVLFRLI